MAVSFKNILCGCILPLAGMVNAQPVSSLNRPNIIVFLVDDMGWQDCSVPFWVKQTDLNRKYHTPNMEQLEKEGMKFTNAYATPVCTPTRISYITGMNAAHHGVTNWTSPKNNNNSDYQDSLIKPANWNWNGLSIESDIPNTVYATALPQLLKESGYFTIHVGKAHWASAGITGSDPLNLGFMINVSGNSTGHPQSYLGKENFGNIPGKANINAVQDLEEYFGTDTFLTEALTLEAIKAMDVAVKSKQPFFLNMAHYAIHLPFDKDERFFQKYMEAGLTEVEAKYASLIEGMDKSLGDIMDWLHKANIEKNTIIIFMSDNGGYSRLPRSGEQFTQNHPLKSGKGSVYEGGIRVPMLVKWPGEITPGAIQNQYVIIEDFFPTILQLAQIKKYKTIQTVDGKSFLPALKNSHYTDTTRTLVWHYPNKWIPQGGPGINYKSAIRKGSWKLIYDMQNRKNELYNLQEDIGETRDLSSFFPEKTKEMAILLSQKLKKVQAKMPLYKESGKSLSWPDEIEKP